MGLDIGGITDWVVDRAGDAANAAVAAKDAVVDTAVAVTDTVVDTASEVFDPANVANFVQQNYDTIQSIAETGQQVGNTIVGGTMAAVGTAGAIPVIGAPIQAASGVASAAATLAQGDFNLEHVLRNAVNGPTTMVGAGLAIAGGGDLHYNKDGGNWYATDAAEWTHGRAGTTYGSMFVTHLPAEEIVPGSDLLTHEAAHSDQYASFGGGIGFPIAYFAEEARRSLAGQGEGCNRFERDAGLEDGGYPPC